jgi:hypothetical protein
MLKEIFYFKSVGVSAFLPSIFPLSLQSAAAQQDFRSIWAKKFLSVYLIRHDLLLVI